MFFSYAHKRDTGNRTTLVSETCTGNTEPFLYFPLKRYTPVDNWKQIQPIPAWWRWFDIFRTLATLKLLPLSKSMPVAAFKARKMLSLGQIKRLKRRTYLQSLLRL